MNRLVILHRVRAHANIRKILQRPPSLAPAEEVEEQASVNGLVRTQVVRNTCSAHGREFPATLNARSHAARPTSEALALTSSKKWWPRVGSWVFGAKKLTLTSVFSAAGI